MKQYIFGIMSRLIIFCVHVLFAVCFAMDCEIFNCLNCTDINGTTNCGECNKGFYTANGTCRHCVNNCQVCFSKSDCQLCDNGYYVLDQVCQKCPDSCAQCEFDEKRKQIICSACEPRYKLRASMCEIDCPSNCVQCTNFSYCENCSEGYYNIDGVCQNCPSHCSTCSSNVNCISCNDGYFGETCNNNCASNCSVCIKTNGTCTTCSARYTGSDCEICQNGFYGSNCSLSCSASCRNKDCNITTGDCLGGCVSGLFGFYCNRTCPVNCSEQVCKQTDGSCLRGCQNGSYGVFCDNTCPINCHCNKLTGLCKHCFDKYYGKFCENKCSSGCRYSLCDRYNGFCIYQCISGKYGPTCNYDCSPFCKDKSCEMNGGVCLDCIVGRYGKHCTQMCPRNCGALGCAQMSGQCIFETDGNMTTVPKDKKSPSNKSCILVIYVAVPAGVVVMIAVAIAVCLARRSIKKAKSTMLNVCSHHNMDTVTVSSNAETNFYDNLPRATQQHTKQQNVTDNAIYQDLRKVDDTNEYIALT